GFAQAGDRDAAAARTVAARGQDRRRPGEWQRGRFAPCGRGGGRGGRGGRRAGGARSSGGARPGVPADLVGAVRAGRGRARCGPGDTAARRARPRTGRAPDRRARGLRPERDRIHEEGRMTPRMRAIVVGMAFLLVAAPAGASDVRVEGTTDTTDSGLIQDVIQPGFEAAYPQYTLKYHATGTGAALTDARAGQADAVLTHAPSSEAQFVQDGVSLEPFGRATFFNDYILIGHNADPANIAGNDPHDAISAMEAIAATGGAGNATWISRGDNSGTHVQEGVMWCMTSGVPVHSLGGGRCEPDDGSGGIPSWYKKTGVGQAQSVQVTAECNFPPASADSCYSMTDRGTYDNLQSQGAIAGMKVVSEHNATNSRGGENLLINPFHVYAVNPNNP